jgi:hypothetical protein
MGSERTPGVDVHACPCRDSEEGRDEAPDGGRGDERDECSSKSCNRSDAALDAVKSWPPGASSRLKSVHVRGVSKEWGRGACAEEANQLVFWVAVLASGGFRNLVPETVRSIVMRTDLESDRLPPTSVDTNGASVIGPGASRMAVLPLDESDPIACW